MSKKRFVAAFISMLIVSLVGVQFVELTTANPYARYMGVTPPADSKPPVITVASPKNNALYSIANFTFAFNITDPQTKNFTMKIEGVSYVTDWQQDPTIIRPYLRFYTNDYSVFPPSNNLSFSCTFSNVTKGNHYIEIDAHCGFYDWNGASMLCYWLNSTSTTYFGTSDSISPETTPPKITITSPENKTYFGTGGVFPLNFSVNEPTSWIGYSLDNLANVTLAGNTTLDVQAGFHTLVIYANDTSGHMSTADTVEFTWQPNLPLPTPSSSPTPSPSIPEFPTWIALSLIAAATLSVTLFAKRKKTRINSTLKRASVEERTAKSNPQLVYDFLLFLEEKTATRFLKGIFMSKVKGN